MDEHLLERYRSGDPQAATALRNHLRSVAARVLDTAQFPLPDADRRRTAEADSARRAMERPSPDVVTYATRTMTYALAAGIRALQDADPAGAGVDAELMARVVMETASAAQAEEFARQMSAHPGAQRHLEAARHALKASVAAREQAEAVEEAPAGRPVPRRGPLGPPRSAARRPPRPKAASVWPLVAALVLVGVVVGVAATRPGVRPEAAFLLPAELPPVEGAWRRGGVVRTAAELVESGDCEGAARTLVAAGSTSTDPFVHWYIGLAWVCARRGPEATAALERARSLAATAPFGFDWWMAQAELLDGSVDEALDRLDALGATEHPRASQARALARDVRRELR